MKTNFIRYHMSRQKFKSVVTETLQTPLKDLSHKKWNTCLEIDLVTCTKFIIRDTFRANLLGITVHSSLRQAAKYSGDFAQPQCSKEFVRIFDCDRQIYYILLGFRSLVMSAILIIRFVICLSFLSSFFWDTFCILPLFSSGFICFCFRQPFAVCPYDAIIIVLCRSSGVFGTCHQNCPGA